MISSKAVAAALSVVPILVFFAGCNSNSGPPSTAASSTSQTSYSSQPFQPSGRYVDETAIAESATTLRFTVMNDSSGVQHTYKNDSQHKKRRILESVGGGGGMFDYDCDGLLDLSFAGGGYYGAKKTLHGHPAALYRNLGDWKFVEV